MPKITDLAATTAPADTWPLAIVDLASGTTKKVTRGDLLKGTVLPANTVTTAAITDLAVTLPKIDLQSSVRFTASNVSGGAPGVVVATTNFSFINGRKYLIVSKNRYAGPSDGGIWSLRVTVNAVALTDTRVGGTTGLQYPSIGEEVYTAAATASYAVAVTATRESGTGTITVEDPRILIIPLVN